MIQFNLLPDVKVQFIKTKRLKRVMIVSALAATAVSVLLLFMMFSYSSVQKIRINNFDKKISGLRGELEKTPDLTKILSVQNQLNSLPELYKRRKAVDRLPGYLDQTTPAGVSINRLILDLETSKVDITGSTGSLEEVNSYVDTLKYASFKTTDEGSQAKTAFSNVVLVEFGRNTDGTTFTISFNYDPLIFDVEKTIQLSVPNLVTTRSQATPEDLFKSPDTDTEETNDGTN